MVTAPGVIRRLTGRHLTVAGMTALMLAGAAVPAAASGQPTLSGPRAGRVPWRQAGPGWSVVQYSTAATSGSPKGAATLYLVSPSGRKYPFYRTPPAAFPSLSLIDWSGDRRRILVQQAGSGTSQRLTYEQISLATGTVVTRFSLPSEVMPLEYTRPRGSGFLATGFGSHLGDFRYDLAGHLRAKLAPGTNLFGLLDAPDGTFIAAGASAGIDLISNTGHIIRRIRIPVPKAASGQLCGPTRWWTRTALLARCFVLGPYDTERLWLVPLRGGAPKPLTPALRSHGLFLGYIDAWRLRGGLYLQADNAHDTLSIVRQFPDGTRLTIHIPGPAGISDFIATSRGPRLLLESGVGVSPSDSLFWYNPATRAIHYVFRTPPKTYGVAGVTTFGFRMPG